MASADDDVFGVGADEGGLYLEDPDGLQSLDALAPLDEINGGTLEPLIDGNGEVGPGSTWPPPTEPGSPLATLQQQPLDGTAAAADGSSPLAAGGSPLGGSLGAIPRDNRSPGPISEEDGGGDNSPPSQQQQQQPQPVGDEVAQRRRKLLELARSKRPAADGEDVPRKKKQRADKTGERSGRLQRAKRQRDRDGEGSGGGTPERQNGHALDEEEVPEEQIVETADDRAFIDDEGVAEDDRYEEDFAALVNAEEAEEVAPGEEGDGDEDGPPAPTNIVDEVLQRRKRAKRRDDENDLENDVVSLISMMSACADKDAAALGARPPRPALHKLRALPEVGRALRQRKYHEAFLLNKGLEAMATWLRPYANGTLPNAKVRGELVELLGVLGLDTTQQEARDALEESGLGKVVMFYFKNPSETMALRSRCRDLIQAWSAPIFADHDEELRKRRQRERAHRQRQAADRTERERRQKLEAELAERRRRLTPRDEGFRTRASVPQPSRMDFVLNPGSRLDGPDDAPSQPGGSGGGASAGAGSSGGARGKASPIGGRLGKVLLQRKRGPRDRFGGVSVEGRGIQL